jgi:hypothetical protein
MTEFNVKFYDKVDGTEPAKDFILELSVKMKSKMLRVINILEVNGPELREPYSKHY